MRIICRTCLVSARHGNGRARSVPPQVVHGNGVSWGRRVAPRHWQGRRNRTRSRSVATAAMATPTFSRPPGTRTSSATACTAATPERFCPQGQFGRAGCHLHARDLSGHLRRLRLHLVQRTPLAPPSHWPTCPTTVASTWCSALTTRRRATASSCTYRRTASSRADFDHVQQSDCLRSVEACSVRHQRGAELGGHRPLSQPHAIPERSVIPRYSPAMDGVQISWSGACWRQVDEITRITSPQRLPTAAFRSISRGCESQGAEEG